MFTCTTYYIWPYPEPPPQGFEGEWLLIVFLAPALVPGILQKSREVFNSRPRRNGYRHGYGVSGTGTGNT
jgi:hypothetical protein